MGTLWWIIVIWLGINALYVLYKILYHTRREDWRNLRENIGLRIRKVLGKQ